MMDVQNQTYEYDKAGALPGVVPAAGESFDGKTLRSATNAPAARKHMKGLRVCMIAYTIYEADNRVMRYAEMLAKQGAHVDVISLTFDNEIGQETIRGVNVVRVQRRLFNEKSKFSFLSQIMKFLLRAMWNVMRRGRYDLVHVHSVPDFLVFSALPAKLRGTKIILDIHDILPELYVSKFNSRPGSLLFRSLLRVERWSAKFADFVIVANDIWRERLASRSIPADKCMAILNFPDRSIFRRQGRKRNDGKFIMIYPGSLNWHQGLDIAIRAFAKIKDQAPQAEFHIYGGPGQIELIALAESLGVGHRVQIYGGRSLPEIATLMENADLGVVPKRRDSFGDEAFSTKILEFMAMGVPVLVSNTTIDQYYFNNSLVRFFRSGDDGALAEAMLELMRNPEQRELLRMNALTFIEDFDWDSNKYKYEGIIDRLLMPRKQAGASA
jgi:glycosyltransferase involved in cell wall biosynthesis